MAKSICVFCGAQNSVSQEYKALAFTLGQKIAQNKWGVVYGGGHVGLMGQVADGCLKEKGLVTGVIPRSLVEKELAHTGVTDLHVVQTMHERKALMADLSNGFLAIPGGFGTFDELCEIITWKQLGIHNKPIGLWNVGGFFNGFLAQVDHCVKEGFIPPHHGEMLIVEADLNVLLERVGRGL